MISRNVDPPQAEEPADDDGSSSPEKERKRKRRSPAASSRSTDDSEEADTADVDRERSPSENGVSKGAEAEAVAGAESADRAAVSARSKSSMRAAAPTEEPDPDADAVPDAELVLEGERLRCCIEALLFASPEPITRRALRRLLREADPKQIDAAVLELEAELLSSARGFHLVEDATGLRLLSVAEFAPFVARLRGEKRLIRLSPAAFETLAVIAYRQPIGRADLDSIRGVQSGPIAKRLHEWNLVHIVGRDDEKIGRPLLYGTTKLFLEQFGLTSLDDLPEPERFLEIGRRQAVEAEDGVDEEDGTHDPVEASRHASDPE